MEYEFKVGDFVETIDGDIGYISSICHCDQCRERGFYEPKVIYNNDTDYITYYEKQNGFKGYRRIGKYEFCKKEHKKIEYLHYEEEYEAKDWGNNVIKRMMLKTSQEHIIDKINEVIDQVNNYGAKDEK